MNQKVEVLSPRSQRRSSDGGNEPPKIGKNVIEGILGRAQQVTLATFYIGCGATVVIWETFGHWSKTLYEGVRPFWKRKGDEKPILPSRKKVLLFPIDHYNRLEVKEVVARLAHLSENELEQVSAYEKEHRNRKTVVDAIKRRLGEGS
jgi:hypothetical protein